MEVGVFLHKNVLQRLRHQQLTWLHFLAWKIERAIGVALAIIRLCPAKIPNEIQLLTSDTNTNNGIEDVEVCTVDENVEKLKWSEEDSREEQAQAKEQYLIKEPAQLGEPSQPQEHGQFENSHTMSLMKSGPEIRESVRKKIKWRKRLCPTRVTMLLYK